MAATPQSGPSNEHQAAMAPAAMTPPAWRRQAKVWSLAWDYVDRWPYKSLYTQQSFIFFVRTKTRTWQTFKDGTPPSHPGRGPRLPWVETSGGGNSWASSISSKWRARFSYTSSVNYFYFFRTSWNFLGPSCGIFLGASAAATMLSHLQLQISWPQLLSTTDSLTSEYVHCPPWLPAMQRFKSWSYEPNDKIKVSTDSRQWKQVSGSTDLLQNILYLT